jgi:hypothetical protein
MVHQVAKQHVERRQFVETSMRTPEMFGDHASTSRFCACGRSPVTAAADRSESAVVAIAAS